MRSPPLPACGQLHSWGQGSGIRPEDRRGWAGHRLTLPCPLLLEPLDTEAPAQNPRSWTRGPSSTPAGRGEHNGRSLQAPQSRPQTQPLLPASVPPGSVSDFASRYGNDKGSTGGDRRMGGQGRCSYHQACAPGTRTRAGWGGQPGKSPSPAAGAKGAVLAQGLQLPSQGQALWGRGPPSGLRRYHNNCHSLGSLVLCGSPALGTGFNSQISSGPCPSLPLPGRCHY